MNWLDISFFHYPHIWFWFSLKAKREDGQADEIAWLKFGKQSDEISTCAFCYMQQKMMVSFSQEAS